MRHGVAQKKLNRSTPHRKALLRNMATELLRRERCETTISKAKALRPVVEKLITLGKKNTLATRRQAYSFVTDKKIVHKLFAEIAPRYKSRQGGYTRIVRTDRRNGDAAELALIELITE